MRKITEIIIHCSATPNGRPHTAEDIHRWHSEPPRNWDGIGYHWVICIDGEMQAGRPEYWQGAHAGSHNSQSIGICLIGTDEFSYDQWDSLGQLVGELRQEYPDAIVIGHNEISDKSCPGFNVQEWMETLP